MCFLVCYLIDLEIGQVTIIGIYRGNYLETDIREKVDKLKALQKETVNACETSDIEDGDISNDNSSEVSSIHYIDVIAVVQDLSI